MNTSHNSKLCNFLKSKHAKCNSIQFQLRQIGVLWLCLAAFGCASIEDCDGTLGDKTNPRIRSSSVRMRLQNPADAYARFAPYAAMSALVYEEAEECAHKLPPVEDKELFNKTLEKDGWKRDDDIPNLPKCDDNIGTFFRVWTKRHTDFTEVVIVFRGTKGGLQDWINGNLRWVTRILPGEDQYEKSRIYTQQVLDYYKNGSGRSIGGKPFRFYSAGHSLGGGLAQNVLYSFPKTFEQAYAFDPSPVTGYADEPIKDSGFENKDEKMRASCECLEATLGLEARIYRIYETDEVLAWVRLPLKLILPPNRQIQEVRLNTDTGHSMNGLAKAAINIAGDKKLGRNSNWWSGQGYSEDGKMSCTDVYNSKLHDSCNKPNNVDACPI